MQKSRYKEWRDHPYALNLRGRPENLEPLTLDKNAPRQSVCIAHIRVWEPLRLPFAIKSNYSKIDFSGLFS